MASLEEPFEAKKSVAVLEKQLRYSRDLICELFYVQTQGQLGAIVPKHIARQ